MLEPHVALPEFDYVKPATLLEACQFLADHPGEARPLLGGTDIFVRMRDGHWHDKYLVDIKGLDGTDDIRFDKQQGLTIGAAVNMNRIIASDQVAATYPLLVQAAKSVASYQLRSRATIVGNICNASPAGDTIGACLAYRGELTIHSLDGERQVPLESFFKGPGKTDLKPGEVVSAIRLPIPPAGAVGRYMKLGRNKLGDLAIVGVTALGYPQPETASGYAFRLALCAVAPTPLRAAEAEAKLAGEPITEATIQAAANLAMQACSPIDDVRGGADYRRLMVRNLTRRAVSKVWNQLA